MAETSTPSRREAVEVDAAEIVVADAADHAAGLAELRHLVDEDRGRSGGEGADERDRLEEAVADLGRHDLDEDLADGDDLLHGPSTALAHTVRIQHTWLKTLIFTSVLMASPAGVSGR